MQFCILLNPRVHHDTCELTHLRAGPVYLLMLLGVWQAGKKVLATIFDAAGVAFCCWERNIRPLFSGGTHGSPAPPH